MSRELPQQKPTWPTPERIGITAVESGIDDEDNHHDGTAPPPSGPQPSQEGAAFSRQYFPVATRLAMLLQTLDPPATNLTRRTIRSLNETMRLPPLTMLCLTAVSFMAANSLPHRSASAEDSWPQWRGDQQNGVASGTAFPQSWSKDEGIAWEIELPGRGGSTPVIDSQAAYLTAGVDGKNHLMAFDLATGDQKWATAIGSDRGNKHKKGSGSNPSAVIDGDHIYAYFRSGDLACVDRDGKVQWHANLQDKYGEDTLWWDLGSSPTVTSNAVVVAVMQTGPSYLVAFDKNSGEVRPITRGGH